MKDSFRHYFRFVNNMDLDVVNLSIFLFNDLVNLDENSISKHDDLRR